MWTAILAEYISTTSTGSNRVLVLVLETSPQKHSEGQWQSFHITGFLFHRLITRQLRWSVCLSDPEIKLNKI